MTFWLTKSFRALQRHWYQRLAESGFEDAEELIADEMELRRMRRNRPPEDHQDRCAAREEYYRMLQCFAAVEEFDSPRDRLIMSMAAEGARQKEIEARLNTLGIRRPPRFLSKERRCRESIRLTIRRYERRWGLRQDERAAG